MLLEKGVTYFNSCVMSWITLIIIHNFFRNEEAKAARLAREIESNPSSQNRANLENGDEEER